MDLLADSRTPKYVQIADVFRQRIARGVWRVGDRLAANEELAAEFGVSRITVRQAVELLSRDKLLQAKQGVGTFISGTPASDRWLRVETTLEDLATVYRDTSPKILNILESKARPVLYPEDGAAAPDYVFMKRVHSRDHKPYCVISIYLDERVFRTNPRRFRKETVIAVLTSMATSVVHKAKQTLTIGIADLEVAKLLQISLHSPVAEVRRVITSIDGTVVYLGEVTYRGDFVRIEMDLKPK